MRVCDKCKKRKEIEQIRIRDKAYDLCPDCLKLVIDFIRTENKRNIFNVFNNG